MQERVAAANAKIQRNRNRRRGTVLLQYLDLLGGKPEKCNTGSRVERSFLAIMLLCTGLMALRVADFAKSRMAGS
jgi:hypothetical protein